MGIFLRPTKKIRKWKIRKWMYSPESNEMLVGRQRKWFIPLLWFRVFRHGKFCQLSTCTLVVTYFTFLGYFYLTNDGISISISKLSSLYSISVYPCHFCTSSLIESTYIINTCDPRIGFLVRRFGFLVRRLTCST